jgi:hypothetical protein
MKLLSHILAFYFLLLSTIPCCVGNGCRDVNTAQAANHERDHKDCGNCSPFFNCEGCATATIACQPLGIEFAMFQASPVYAIYFQESLPQVGYDFWQPPRLG